MLKKFQTTNKNYKLNLLQSTHTLPLKNNFFDVVIMNSVTMYLPDQDTLKQSLTEMERVATEKGILFVGDNITPSGSYWELIWFQKLSTRQQSIVKSYIQLRKWLAKKVPILAGKWANIYAEVSPEFIKSFFKERGSVSISDAAAYSARKKRLGENANGSKRIDFIINLE